VKAITTKHYLSFRRSCGGIATRTGNRSLLHIFVVQPHCLKFASMAGLPDSHMLCPTSGTSHTHLYVFSWSPPGERGTVAEAAGRIAASGDKNKKPRSAARLLVDQYSDSVPSAIDSLGFGVPTHLHYRGLADFDAFVFRDHLCTQQQQRGGGLQAKQHDDGRGQRAIHHIDLRQRVEIPA
jgi:hypothetical protein